MKYWLGVVSKEHVMRGVKLGIAQIGHGKRSGLMLMKAGDGLIYYSPKQSLKGAEPLQAFTTIGVIADDDIWQADEGDFKPWRRRAVYQKAQDAPIRPLLEHLSFTQGRTNWGYSFRFGLVEITKEDYEIIAEAMKAL
jgi:hypothetical protein